MPDSLRPHELEPTRLLYPWDSPSKNTGVGGRNQKEERIQSSSRKEINFPYSLEKGDLKHNKLKRTMKRQRNTTQMKEQMINAEVQINEEEIGQLPEKEFRTMIAKMIKNLENKMEKMQESINKDLYD